MSNQSLLDALQLARDGDWNAAHEIVQDLRSPGAARIHGYLHRVEGDNGNARYWYNQAGVDFPNVSTDQEWEQIFSDIFDGS